MKLTHSQVRRRFEAALDAAHPYELNLKFDPTLSEHLTGCPKCRAYVEQASEMDAHLARNLPGAWQVPDFSGQKIEQAIHIVHDRLRRKHTMNRQNLWSGFQQVWRWGIGLAGIAILVGVLYFGMRLIPKNTRAPGAAQPSLTNPILSTQTVMPTATAGLAPQRSGKPIPGDWVATTDFGKFILTVDDTGTKIKKTEFRFSEWTCGSVTQSSEIVDASSWLITDSKFTLYSTFDRYGMLTMQIDGTYDATSQKFVGTWEEAASGTVCSGTWEASIQH